MAVSATDFEFVRQIVLRDSALALPDGKEYLVDSRLAPVVERAGLASVADLLQGVRAGAPGLRQHVVEALATHESHFFRDLHPFDALREIIIPAALRADPQRRLTFWSAAAATGQEAYSLALLMREHFPGVPATVLATDLSREVLDRAQTGRFSQLEVNRGLPIALLAKYFDRQGGDWQLHEEVRQMVTFRQLNLDGPLSRVPPMDVVLLRNLLIYFPAQAKQALLARMSEILRPDGYLFLGAAETTYGVDDRYTRVRVGRSVCYRRPAVEGTTHGRDRR